MRRVCADCNNGWLSDLEEKAKPIFEPLISGGARVLTPAEADTAALWCVKTAFMFQFTHPTRREVPNAHYRWLYENGRPPGNTFAWLAKYSGAHWSGWYQHDIVGLRDPGGPETGDRAYCVTVTAGSLVFQVIGSDALDPLEMKKVSEKEPYIVQVWPSERRRVQLPPPLPLNDKALLEFSDPFGAVKRRI